MTNSKIILLLSVICYLPPDLPKRYLTVNDVAKIFGITPLTVRNWDKKGALLAYRNPVNNYRMYKIEDVEVLMRRIEHSKPQTRKLKIDVF